MLGGRQPIISSDLRLRQDGLPYSTQKTPDDQGVAVYFMWNNEQMVIACDTFDLIGCNLWAVSKTVEAMRGIERWGCSELLNRAFTGFKALPAAATIITNWWDVLECDEFSFELEIRKAYRDAAKQYHPDNQMTGDEVKFKAIRAAYELALESLK